MGNCPHGQAKRYSPTVKGHYVYRVTDLYIYLSCMCILCTCIFIFCVYLLICVGLHKGTRRTEPYACPPFIAISQTQKNSLYKVSESVVGFQRNRQLFKFNRTQKTLFRKKLINAIGGMNPPIASTLRSSPSTNFPMDCPFDDTTT